MWQSPEQCGPEELAHLLTGLQMLQSVPLPELPRHWASESSWRGLRLMIPSRVSDGRLPGFKSKSYVILGNLLNVAEPPFAHLWNGMLVAATS